MKKPPFSILIANPSNHNKFKIPVLKSDSKLRIMKKLLIDIYKRLNTKASKRVINVYKREPSFDVINNQMFVKFNGVAPMEML